ncbi:hypothetical protein [Roseovarius ramblicola]|uniref:Uncharacterized protein n=1 Tax=Roseovarius ramblicola TaxID=2022336 RepID=A0ABV5I1Z4_9RHOB
MTDTSQPRGRIAARLCDRTGSRGPARDRLTRRADATLQAGQRGTDHPRLARLLAPRTADAAPGGSGRRARRKTALLRIAGGIVLNLMLFGALLYLLWRYVLSA